MRVNKARLGIATWTVTPTAIASTVLTGTAGLNPAITIALDVIAAVLVLGVAIQRVMRAEHDRTRQLIHDSFEQLTADVVRAINAQKDRADDAEKVRNILLANYDGSNVRQLH